MKTIRLLISLLLVLSFMLTACTGEGQQDGSAGTEQPTAATDLSIVRMAVADTPTLDPAVSATEAACILFPNVYDSLVWPENDGSVSLSVAESYTVSNDGLAYDFTIRKGVKFHNGDEMKASDVAYSMNRAITIAQGLGFLWTNTVESAEVIDDYVVRFNMNFQSGTFVSSLVRLYILNEAQVQANAQSGSYGEFGDYGMRYLLNNDAGSGPYMVTEFAQDQYITIERFDDYWDGFKENNPQKGRLIVVHEAVTQMTMMSRKELEITDPYMTIEFYENLEKIDGIEVARIFKGDLMSLSTNTRRAPLDCEHVRKALAYLIDYESVIRDIYPGSRITTSNVPESVLGVSKTAFNYYYDVDKAREELAKSKYADNIGDYPIEVAWVANTPDREKLALMLQANAMQIGFNIEVVKTQWATIVETAATPETTFHMVTIITAPDYSEVGALYELCHTTREIGNQNSMSWYFSDYFDEMIKDAVSTIDADERAAKYVVLQNEYMETVPTIPLFEQQFFYGYQESYMDWGTADRSAAGESATPPLMGYCLYLRDMLIYPELR